MQEEPKSSVCLRRRLTDTEHQRYNLVFPAGEPEDQRILRVLKAVMNATEAKPKLEEEELGDESDLELSSSNLTGGSLVSLAADGKALAKASQGNKSATTQPLRRPPTARPDPAIPRLPSTLKLGASWQPPLVGPRSSPTRRLSGQGPSGQGRSRERGGTAGQPLSKELPKGGQEAGACHLPGQDYQDHCLRLRRKSPPTRRMRGWR